MLILLGASSYGVLSPTIKLAYRSGWPDLQITASQMTMGTLLVWLLVAVTPAAWSNPFRGPWIKLALHGIVGLALTNIFLNAALVELNATLAIVMLFQFTWITVLFDAWSKKRWPSAWQWGAILLILAGTVLAVGLPSTGIGHISLKGVLLGLGAAVSYSCLLFFTGRIESRLHPLMKSAYMLTATLPLIYILQPPDVLFQAGGGELVLWGLLLGFLGQVVPTIFFNIGIPRVGSSLAAMLGAVELPVAMLTALLLLGEGVLTLQWLGILLIVGGILVSEKMAEAR